MEPSDTVTMPQGTTGLLGQLTVNGKRIPLEQPVTIADFLSARGLHQKTVVVEHNGEIVPRERYGVVALNAGDTVEIVQMMAGG